MPWQTHWVNAHMEYLLAVWWATATIRRQQNRGVRLIDYDKIVTTKEAGTIDAFSCQAIHAKTKTAHRGEGINIMTQTLCVDDGFLCQGLTVQNAYAELCSGSKIVPVVLRNSTAYPQTLRKKAPVARADAVTWTPELPMQISSTKASEENHGHQVPRLTMKQWQEKLFKELDLSSLESCHLSWQ